MKRISKSAIIVLFVICLTNIIANAQFTTSDFTITTTGFSKEYDKEIKSQKEILVNIL